MGPWEGVLGCACLLVGWLLVGAQEGAAGAQEGREEAVEEQAGVEEVTREEQIAKGKVAGEGVGEKPTGCCWEGVPGGLLGGLAAALAGAPG